MPKPVQATEARNNLSDVCREFLHQRRIGQRAAEQEDIDQDAIVRALVASPAEQIRQPLYYLLRIARNLLADRKRRQAREIRVHQALHRAGPVSTEMMNPERIYSARQELQQVLAAIDALPPRCREAFVLHRFEHLSYSAIARRMGVSTGTVEKHIAQAMTRITRAIHESAGEQ